jgi:hypothetical protein
MIELTTEQRQALAQSGSIRMQDPETGQSYFLVRADVYERLKAILSEDAGWAQDSLQAAMEVFARDGWNDPRMDVYDALDPRRKP